MSLLKAYTYLPILQRKFRIRFNSVYNVFVLLLYEKISMLSLTIFKFDIPELLVYNKFEIVTCDNTSLS